MSSYDGNQQTENPQEAPGIAKQSGAHPDELGDAMTTVGAKLYPPLEDVKDRFAEVLERIKTRVDGMKHSGFGSDPVGVANKTNGPVADTSKTAPSSGETAGSDFDHRKEQFLVLLQAAESRVRAAEEKHRQTESNLATEISKREKAEQRIHEIEQNFHSQTSSLETEELRLLEALEALEKTQAQLKSNTEAHAATEQALAEARNALNESTQRLNLIETEKADAESNAHAASEQARKATAKLREKEKAQKIAEDKAAAAEQTLRDVENLINESHAMANEVQQKYKVMEETLRQETELRLFAEQQLRALAEELHLNLGAGDFGRAPNAKSGSSVPVEGSGQAAEIAAQSKTTKQQRVAVSLSPGSFNGIMNFNRTFDDSLTLIEETLSMAQVRNLSIACLLVLMLYSIIVDLSY